MDANEDLVVVWTGYAGIGGTGVFGRRFDRDGSPVGERFVVTDSQRAGERGPALAMSPDGSFVVAWQTNDQDGESVGVFARVFDSAADAVGPVRQLNVKASGMAIDPAVATGGSSDFSAVWTLVGPDELSEAIVGRHFDASGIAASPEFRISNASDRVSEPVAAIAADDSLLVVWQAEALAGVTTDIFARAFRAGADVDDDGVINEQDNCPTVPNPEQTDAASDGYGDDCVSPDVFLPPDARLGAAPIIGLGTVIGSGVVLGDFARIGEHVRLAPRVQAGDGLIAADLVTIGRSSVLGDNVTIDLAAALDANVTIGDAVTIHERAYVRRGAVVGARASIGRSALLGPFSRIGASATIETGVGVGRGASVAPGATVPAGVVVQPGTTFP
jgi:UDP-3-O-[3-hydroxymyristoyl] glucosamine N-acyltransferase